MTARRAIIVAFLIAVAGLAGPHEASAERPAESSQESRKGFFSVGGFYGLGSPRFLNTDGTYANYKTNIYGGDLDILIWDASVGDIRLYLRQQSAKSSESKNAGSTVAQSETTFGLKIYAGSHLYLAGGMGTGRTDLRSSADNTSLHLDYDVMRAGLGLEFGVSASFFLAFEADYRSAPVRVNRNPQLNSNTFMEGIGGALRLIWSPPSVTITYSK